MSCCQMLLPLKAELIISIPYQDVPGMRPVCSNMCFWPNAYSYNVCVYVQWMSACLHECVIIYLYIFLHQVPVNTLCTCLYLSSYWHVLRCVCGWECMYELCYPNLSPLPFKKAINYVFRGAWLPFSAFVSNLHCYTDIHTHKHANTWTYNNKYALKPFSYCDFFFPIE